MTNTETKARIAENTLSAAADYSAPSTRRVTLRRTSIKMQMHPVATLKEQIEKLRTQLFTQFAAEVAEHYNVYDCGLATAAEFHEKVAALVADYSSK